MTSTPTTRRVAEQPRKARSAGRGRAHLESGEIDVQRRAGSPRHDQETAPGVQLQPEARQIGSGQGIEVDAASGAIAGVQGMDERRLTRAVIQGVRPAAVGARCAGERLTPHLLSPLMGIDDRGLDQPARVEVVDADVVLRRVERGRVLDEVERGPVRRDRVEAEVSVQRDGRSPQERSGVQHGEPRLGPRETGTRLDQDERAPITRKPAGGSVIGNRGNRERPRQKQRSVNAAAPSVDSRDNGVCARRDSHVARLAGGRRDAGRTDVHTEHR